MVQVSGGQLITSSGQPIMVQAMSGAQGQTIMQLPVSGAQGLQQVSAILVVIIIIPHCGKVSLNRSVDCPIILNSKMIYISL